MWHSLVERQLSPVLAAVRRLPQSAASAAGRESPGQSLHAPERRVEHARILRIHRQIDRTSGIVDEEHLLPVATTIAGAEDAAHRIWSRAMTHRGDVGDIRIAWVDDDPRDVPRVV